ncbi:MAG: hypothetical protein F9Y92_05635 [Thermoplasmatales archaeon]|nr:hypothetical protein [Thermoplasmatales archaeon]
MSVSLTLGKYGILAVAAVFPVVEAAVFGAMAVAVPAGNNIIAETIRALAAVAIVVAIGREYGPYHAIAAGIGLAGGWVASETVQDAFMAGFSQFISQWVNVAVQFALKGFLLGVAAGVGIAVSPIALLSPVIGFLLGLIAILATRAVGLLESALDGVVHAIFKGLPLGVKGLVAPYFGGISIGMIFLFTIAWFTFIVGAALGVAVGIAIVAVALGWTVVFTLIGFIAFIGYIAGLVLANLLAHTRIDYMPFIDAILLVLFPWLGPALYTAGYAALLTRRKSMGLYLISLGVLSLSLPKLPI